VTGRSKVLLDFCGVKSLRVRPLYAPPPHLSPCEWRVRFEELEELEELEKLEKLEEPA
jgi:hypothetical protein